MHSIMLSELSFYLINIGCFLRVYSQIMIGLSRDNYYSLIGFSGWIELAAIGIFGYNIWKTMNKEDEEIEEPEDALTEITEDTNIASVVEQYPETLDVFLEFGFKQLGNPVARRTVAKMFTIRQAAKIHPVDMSTLLKALNSKIKKS